MAYFPVFVDDIQNHTTAQISPLFLNFHQGERLDLFYWQILFTLTNLFTGLDIASGF